MVKKLVSFGHKNGVPVIGSNGSIIIDVRMFRNPYHVSALRNLTGVTSKVQRYIADDPDFRALYSHVKEQIESYSGEVVYLGCTGGKHRSPALVEMISKELGVEKDHRDL
jgi:UPF0042 nucleotide-binding protein